MAQNVHSGIGGDRRRDRSHQRRVENGDIRQQRRIHQHQFFGIGLDDRKGGHFGTGTAGGRDRHEAGTLASGLRTGLRQGENNRFGRVNDRPAAQRHHQIRIAGIHQLHPADDSGDIRIRYHVIPDLEGDAALAPGARHAFGETKFDHRLVGHQQDVAGGELVQNR